MGPLRDENLAIIRASFASPLPREGVFSGARFRPGKGLLSLPLKVLSKWGRRSFYVPQYIGPCFVHSPIGCTIRLSRQG